MTNINETITSRETYIAWRTEWRATYKALSREIRATKYKISNTFRAGDYAGPLQNQLRKLRDEANEMLDTREAAKKFAVEQREKSRQLEEA